MSESMIERVAKAICQSAYENTPGARAAGYAPFVELHWRNHVGGAKSAIQAMRDISFEMDRAGFEAQQEGLDYEGSTTP